jgi:hypothetical protein
MMRAVCEGWVNNLRVQHVYLCLWVECTENVQGRGCTLESSRCWKAGPIQVVLGQRQLLCCCSRFAKDYWLGMK